MVIEREEIVLICTSDMAGQVRGKGFPARDLEARRQFGVGWTHSCAMINCFGRIPATPFGPRGDLNIVPAPGGDMRLDYGDGGAVEHLILGDIVTLQGTRWACCLRGFLAGAAAALEREAGLRVLASFEHEFWLDAAADGPASSYGASRMRGVEAFAGDLLGALRANALGPDTFMPEFGPRQFEITVDPALAPEAADRAVKLREITRSVARRHGHRASFSPVVTRGFVGNGVHIHFSLCDRDGRPVTFEAGRPGGLSPVAASFAAGILDHAPALVAVTAPSAISHERLRPQSWSAYHANIAERDREALLRICPIPEAPDVDVARRFNLEFRGADAAASPYLALGMLIHAGLDGVKRRLPARILSVGDPGELSAEERAARGFGELPHGMGEALDALEADPAAMGWLGPELSEAYLMHKRGELAMAALMDVEELCRLYALIY
jgi:glutamine synthetase